MMEPELSESELEGLYIGEASAVDSWFRAYGDPLYTFIYYRVGADAELAADITQETFLKALGEIQEFDPRRGSMLAWLTTLSRNIMRKHIKDRSTLYPNAPGVAGDLVIIYEQIATQPLPDEVLELKETADLVRATLTTIPGNYNRLLCDHYFRRMDIRAISQLYRLSESAVKSQLHRARLAFKETFVRLAGALYVAPSAKGGSNA
jgi:RNA polymerase sigma-70 factor (ECF subfamily)